MSHSLNGSKNAPHKGLRDFIVDNAAPGGHVSTKREHFPADMVLIPDGQRETIGGIAPKDRVQIEARGDIKLKLANGQEVTLQDVAFVPKALANIFSVRTALKQLNGQGTYVEEQRSSKIVADGGTIVTASERSGFMYLNLHQTQDFC